MRPIPTDSAEFLREILRQNPHLSVSGIQRLHAIREQAKRLGLVLAPGYSLTSPFDVPTAFKQPTTRVANVPVDP